MNVSRAPAGERGAALVLALLAGLLLSAIGTSLVVLTSADVLIADNGSASAEAFHAAEGALERAFAELQQAADFTGVLNGTVSSRFVDGPPHGVRTLADGVRVDLAEVVNLANCESPEPCTEAAIVARSRSRPWGARNPRWRLFAYGPLNGGTGEDVPCAYVVVEVADDPSDTDGLPWEDGASAGQGVNPGAGVLLVRAEGFGRRSAHRVIEAVVMHPDLAARAMWAALEPAARGEPPPITTRLLRLGWRAAR